MKNSQFRIGRRNATVSGVQSNELSLVFRFAEGNKETCAIQGRKERKEDTIKHQLPLQEWYKNHDCNNLHNNYGKVI